MIQRCPVFPAADYFREFLPVIIPDYVKNLIFDIAVAVIILSRILGIIQRNAADFFCFFAIPASEGVSAIISPKSPPSSAPVKINNRKTQKPCVRPARTNCPPCAFHRHNFPLNIGYSLCNRKSPCSHKDIF